MATNRSKRTRTVVNPLTDWQLAYLTDDDANLEKFSNYQLICYRSGLPEFDGTPHPRELWNQYRDEFLPAFIAKNPCKRPLPWHQWDAPRWQDPFEDCFFHLTLQEPRLRIGGIGTPNYEVLGYVPHFEKGIPESWVSKFDEEYYNGRAKNKLGNTIVTNYKEGHFKGVAIDPDDPPVYESEAAYLLRHDLLTPAEIKYLEKHPKLMEPEKVSCHND